jgi:hypothetical protein
MDDNGMQQESNHLDLNTNNIDNTVSTTLLKRCQEELQ